MGSSVLSFELDVGHLDDFDLDGLGFVRASLEFCFLFGIHLFLLGVDFLALGVELLHFVAFQSPLSERDLEGFLLENLILGSFFHPCA